MEASERDATPSNPSVKSPYRLLRNYWAVKRFGHDAWNGKPRKEKPTILPGFISTTLESLPILPTLDAIDGIAQKISGTPSKPNFE